MKRYVCSFLLLSIITFLVGCADNAQTYTVTYKSDSEIIATFDVNEGSDAPIPDDPTKAGYTFTGWQGSHTSISKDTMLTAQFEPITEEDPDQIEDEEIVIPFEDRPILVLTYLEEMDSVLEKFLDHPFEVVKSILDVDLTDYQRMLVLYEDSLRRTIPPRLFGSPSLDAFHFVTVTHDENIEVTMINMDEKADFERFLTTVDLSIFEIREPKFVYDYYPITGTAIIDTSSQFDTTPLLEVLGENTSLIKPTSFMQTLLYEEIYAFLGERIPSYLSEFENDLQNLDGAMTIIETDRGQRFVIGRATGEWKVEYYENFVKKINMDIDEPTDLELSVPEGITRPQNRITSADFCVTSDLRGTPPGPPKESTTVSHDILETRLNSTGTNVGLAIRIGFDEFAPVISDDEYLNKIKIAHQATEEFYFDMSEGKLLFEWNYYPEIVYVPFFLDESINSGSPGYMDLINDHIDLVLEQVEENFDLSGVDFLTFYWPLGLPDYVGDGLAELLSERMDTKNGNIYNYILQELSSNQERLSFVVTHEVAHMLGLTDTYVHAWVPEFSGKPSTFKYGHWDLMAANNELKAWHRWILSWMPNEEVYCIPKTTNQIYDVFLEPLNSTEAETRQIVISISETEAISIELRGPSKYCNIGCDQNILVTHIDTNTGNGHGPLTILRPDRAFMDNHSDSLLLENEYVQFENITIIHSKRAALGSIVTIEFD